MLHSSGNYMKIDADGNVTQYIKGNLKMVVDGDYAVEVRGSIATQTTDHYLTTTGKKETLVQKTHKQTDNGGLTINSKTTINKNVTIEGSTKTKDISATSIVASDSLASPLGNIPKIVGLAKGLW